MHSVAKTTPSQGLAHGAADRFRAMRDGARHAGDRDARLARCSDARSMAWIGDRAGSEQRDSDPLGLRELPNRDVPSGTVPPPADHQGARMAARQFRIGLAVTFMALATGLATTAAAAADERDARQHSVSARNLTITANSVSCVHALAAVRPIPTASVAAHAAASRGRDAGAEYWAPCRRSYHVGAGEYRPCPAD